MKYLPVLAYILLGVFVHLKLSGSIAWDWLWVTAPIWILFSVQFALGFIFGFHKAFKRKKIN